MTAGRMVIKRNYCHWKTKTNSNKKKQIKAGFISPWFVIFLFVLASGVYLYFINCSATKGYQVRQIEKDIADLKKENETLRIKEAELKSLYRIEESSKQLNMAETVQVSFIENGSPVAMK